MKKEQVLGMIRHALTFIGGVLVIKGLSNETNVEETIGAVMTAIGFLWSVIKNK